MPLRLLIQHVVTIYTSSLHENSFKMKIHSCSGHGTIVQA